jgi:hypothetical protein
MSGDDLPGNIRAASGAKQARIGPYTSKDFQLEVLGLLAEVHETTEALREAVATDLGRTQEQRKRLPFDGRTLVAVGALALSITGYILQDARNTSKRDAEIETTRARVARVEETDALNTEGRVRTEVELRELRDGQAEIKRIIVPHEGASKSSAKRD